MITLVVGASAQAVAGERSASIIPSRSSQANRMFMSWVFPQTSPRWSVAEKLMTARAGARHLVVAKQLRNRASTVTDQCGAGGRAHLPGSAADSFHRRP